MNRFGEFRERQVALPRHVAEVPAPAEIVHRQTRRVRDLHEEQLVDADVADARARNAAGQGVEAVENQPDRRMIDVADQAPRIAMVERVPRPRERLIADAHAPLRRPLTERRQVIDETRPIADSERRAVRAQQDQIRAELLHDVELSLDALERSRELLGRHAFEIAKRLKQRALHAEVANDAADLAGRARKAQQIVLEDLHAVEAGLGHGAQLAFERAADRNGRDRRLHLECYELVRTQIQAASFARPLEGLFALARPERRDGAAEILAAVSARREVVAVRQVRTP